MALICVEKDDGEINFEKMVDKLIKYRIFEDDSGRMNLSLQDIQGEIIIVPQFTLAADTKKVIAQALVVGVAQILLRLNLLNLKGCLKVSIQKFKLVYLEQI